MLIVKDISEVTDKTKPIVLAMGCFDGVHLGHQKVILEAILQAKKINGQAWIYTFKPHPAKFLVPDKAPLLISTERDRIKQIEKLGVEGIIETKFDADFAALSAENFLRSLIKKTPNLKGIVCGKDWSFGFQAKGDFQLLEEFGEKHGFGTTHIVGVCENGIEISSTAIRKAIKAGDIPTAAKLLGHPFSSYGKVVEGRKIGRTIGFPTANIEQVNELMPSDGVYAGRTLVDNKWIDSAVFIGVRPTFACKQHALESHLLNFDGDLYGKYLEIIFVKKIRDNKRFPSKEALIEQINFDITQIRKILTSDKK